MTTLIIILLILLGVALMIAEVLLLPGVTLAAICSFISFAIALYISFVNFGIVGAAIAIAAILAASVVLFYYSTKRKNLKKLSLEEVIDSKSSEDIDKYISIGNIATTRTRLNPMGNIEYGGKLFEAKSIQGLINQSTTVEVVGFENNTPLVKENLTKGDF